MRLVPVNCIKEGSYLAKTIYDKDGRVLLAKGVKLSRSIIKRVDMNGILSLYINDEYSDNEIEDVIKPELRQKAIAAIKEGFNVLAGSSNLSRASNAKIKYEYIKKLTEVVNDIIEEILYRKDILINLVDIKSMDNYTYQHCVNVTILSVILAAELKYNKSKLFDLAIGAILHDIGKIFTPPEVLKKPGRLTENEFITIKKHPQQGYEYSKSNNEISSLSRIVILQHHEKVDGTGYPEGIDGNKIHEFAKIAAIADVYDALTSDRPYRKAMSPSEAMEYLMASGGTQFDYDMIRIFVKKIVPYPEGTLVRLSNGAVGVVEEINPNYPLRPKIRLISGDEGVIIDLMFINNIVIEGIQYAF